MARTSRICASSQVMVMRRCCDPCCAVRIGSTCGMIASISFTGGAAAQRPAVVRTRPEQPPAEPAAEPDESAAWRRVNRSRRSTAAALAVLPRGSASGRPSATSCGRLGSATAGQDSGRRLRDLRLRALRVPGDEALTAAHGDANLGVGLRHRVRALHVEVEHDANDARAGTAPCGCCGSRRAPCDHRPGRTRQCAHRQVEHDAIRRLRSMKSATFTGPERAMTTSACPSPGTTLRAVMAPAAGSTASRAGRP